jgi:hypothetical protein
MKVAIIGSRGYSDFHTVVEFLSGLKQHYGNDLEIISGGAEGPDKVAELWCKSNDVKITVIPADFENGGKGAGIKRNTQIIDSADQAMAFWDGESSGTLDGIVKAKKTKKPIQVSLA